MKPESFPKHEWEKAVNPEEGYSPNRIDLGIRHKTLRASAWVTDHDLIVNSNGVHIVRDVTKQGIKFVTLQHSINE